MSRTYSDLQLDALREVANIGSGRAGTALAQMLGRAVDLTVPTVLALPLAEAVEAVGDPESEVTAVAIPIFGEMDAVVVLLFAPSAAATLCELLGVEPGSDVGRSALQEIGNILGTSYVGAIEEMTALRLEPRPPHLTTDMLGAIVSTVLAEVSGASELALVLDSSLQVEGHPCSLSFVLVPERDSVGHLLSRLGLAT
jgi:chemotaxis protein CheC